MPKIRRKPAYNLHAASGQARCRIDGKDHYLGVYGTQESRDRYDDLIAEWVVNQDTSTVTLTIAEQHSIHEACRRLLPAQGRDANG